MKTGNEGESKLPVEPENNIGGQHKHPPLPSLESLGLRDLKKEGRRLSGDELPKMGKFRFQLLADWIALTFAPCRVADIGGGKGVLSYFLREHGFDSVVIDPVPQELPEKIKDIRSGKQLRFKASDRVPHLNKPFIPEMANDFDLMVALHAHGSNIHIIDAAAANKNQFVILPCCVIDEPLTPPRGVNWFEWLTARGTGHGFDIKHFQINFSGQNIGFYNKVKCG